MIQILNQLENFDLKSMGRQSAETMHLMIEATRRAFLDRARHLGDPDFVQVPVARLTDKAYAKTLAQGIDRARATKSTEIGKDIVTVAQREESEETTHFSVIEHVHARGRLRLTCGGEGRGIHSQQRNGRFQQEAWRDEPHG
jgi:gamma-glutamyltranspeptidase/glutathione hydrolase